MLLPQKDTEQMLEAILASIDEGIHVINKYGKTIYYNKMAAKHDGLQVADVIGKHVLSVFPSLSEETSTLIRVMKTGDPIYNQSQTYKNIKGELIDTVNTTLPIEVNNEIIGAVEIAKDIRQVKRLSEKLLELQAKVQPVHKEKTTLFSGAKYQVTDIISCNNAIETIKRKLIKTAKSSSPVLVSGETGTGKELIVQSIHNASTRKNQPFIVQNCAAIPASLLESLLFGTVKGSFTGAQDRKGLFELAHNGTLFLDEFNSMPLDLQAKFLRVIEDGIVRKIGGTQSNAVDVRVIVAMNEKPEDCLKNNKLRADLYYRLNVFGIHIPPLRNRNEDIPLLVDHFIKKFNYQFGKLVTDIAEDTMVILKNYNWPGNIRELVHTIEYSMNMVEDTVIRPHHLPDHLLLDSGKPEVDVIKPLREVLQGTEQKMIEQALHYTNGNIQKAAKLLHIPRQTLQYKMSKLINSK